MILIWVQARLKDYPIPMTNFSTCWNDGLAFCALIHVFYPDNFDWHALDAKNRRHNFTFGFEKAEELAGIYPLLEVDDMVRFQKPDWKCVFTYVQSYYRRFRDGRSPPPRPIVNGPKAPLSEVALACLATQDAERKAKELVGRTVGGAGQATVGQEVVGGEVGQRRVKTRPAPLLNLAQCNISSSEQQQETTSSPVEAEEASASKDDFDRSISCEKKSEQPDENDEEEAERIP